MKIAIIGAGLTGACCALALAREGHRVEVFDSARVGTRTSANSGSAILFQTKDNPLLIALTARSLALWDGLAASGLAPFRRDGSLCLFSTAEDEAFLAERAALLRSHGIAVTALGSVELSGKLPELHSDIAGAFHCAEDGEANPHLSAVGIAKAAAEARAAFRLDTEVTSLVMQGGRVVGLESAAGRHSADAVIVAAGPQTAAFVAPFGIALPVTPERGEQLLTPPQPPLLKGRILSPRYMRGKTLRSFAGLALGQEPDGRIKIGSTREPGETALETSQRGREALLSDLASCLPELASLPIERHTVGLRSSSKTGRPIVSICPTVDGLFVVDGLAGNGVAFAPLIGEILAGLVAGRGHEFADDLRLPA